MKTMPNLTPEWQCPNCEQPPTRCANQQDTKGNGNPLVCLNCYIIWDTNGENGIMYAALLLDPTDGTIEGKIPADNDAAIYITISYGDINQGGNQTTELIGTASFLPKTTPKQERFHRFAMDVAAIVEAKADELKIKGKNA